VEETDSFGKETKLAFLDSVGREIELPQPLTRIAPSGTLADIVLYTACPDLLCGISIPFTETQLKLIDPKYDELPVMGKFYGKGPDFNLETVLAAQTQVIVDIGEPKDSIASDLDELMGQIKIPTVFIEALFDGMPQTYRDIGRLIGDHSRTDLLADYCEETLALVNRAREEIPPEERVRVYWAMGELGLNTNAVGSFHSELLDYIPVTNVAEVEVSNRGGGSEVSMEQIILWDPDYILIDTLALAGEIIADPAWQSLPAIKEGRYVVVPTQPYGFLANPPSINRYLGMRWLGSLLYPELYTAETEDEVRDFFSLFYRIELDDSQLEAILDGTFN
jgi:iron complex transport system substrate-binding protein